MTKLDKAIDGVFDSWRKEQIAHNETKDKLNAIKRELEHSTIVFTQEYSAEYFNLIKETVSTTNKAIDNIELHIKVHTDGKLINLSNCTPSNMFKFGVIFTNLFKI